MVNSYTVYRATQRESRNFLAPIGTYSILDGTQFVELASNLFLIPPMASVYSNSTPVASN